jgi:hypothetical protein
MKFTESLLQIKEYQLKGKFSLSKPFLIPIDSKSYSKLQICYRKNPTKVKPKRFLLLVPPEGKKQYISSLYPLSENSFHFDYNGQSFELSYQNSIVEIKEHEGMI